MPNETAGPRGYIERRGDGGVSAFREPGEPRSTRAIAVFTEAQKDIAVQAARRECAEELLGTDGLIGCTGPECSCPDDDIAERCGLARALAAKWRS